MNEHPAPKHALSYYQEFLAQREAVMAYKWIQSEKAGHDIGFDQALVSWVRNEREAWRKNRAAKQKAR